MVPIEENMTRHAAEREREQRERKAEREREREKGKEERERAEREREKKKKKKDRRESNERERKKDRREMNEGGKEKKVKIDVNDAISNREGVKVPPPENRTLTSVEKRNRRYTGNTVIPCGEAMDINRVKSLLKARSHIRHIVNIIFLFLFLILLFVVTLCSCLNQTPIYTP